MIENYLLDHHLLKASLLLAGLFLLWRAENWRTERRRSGDGMGMLAIYALALCEGQLARVSWMTAERLVIGLEVQ